MNTKQTQVIFTPRDIERLIGELARRIIESHNQMEPVALIGVRTGGVYLAQRLMSEIERLSGGRPDTGAIDITLYRDDWTRLHNRPIVGRTAIDFAVEERVLILVDDVLYTGRTTRAAMDALIDLGRPRRIELCV
jgi:pyrimidine operon attenuation protein/uracil phosphoribosyltransferase